MPFTFDDSDLLSKLDTLMLHIPQQAERGLDEVAAEAQTTMQATSAHGDITGATRASYRAIVIGGGRTGQAEAESGLEAAIAAIAASKVDHGGRPASQDSGIHLTPDERGVILTSFTDYQDDLEKSPKAVLAPTLQEYLQAFTQAVAREGL